jgi:pyruvate dehydrogenase phosphatase
LGLKRYFVIGDARYKWPLSVQQVVNPFFGRRIPPNLLTPPYVTAEPEVTFYERDNADEFLVIACDGLWDEMSSNTSVKIVTELIDKGYNQNYATALIQAAISGYGSGGVILDASRIQHSLSIPVPHSRRFRDDMTVGVLFFPGKGRELRSDDVSSKTVPMVSSPPSTIPPQIYDWVAKLKNLKQHTPPASVKPIKSKL